MILKATVTILILLLEPINHVFSCKLDWESYKEFRPIERMLLSDNVIYGKDLNHFQHKDDSSDEFPFNSSTWANVSVYAILKKKVEVLIPATIKIRRIEPRIDCSGTDNLQPGQEYIFMIQKPLNVSEDVFELHEVNAHQTAAVNATDELLIDAVETCLLNDVRPPDGQMLPVDPQESAAKMQSIASHAANNETCKMIRIDSYGNGNGNGGNGVSGLNSKGDTFQQLALAALNLLAVAIFSLLF